MPQKHMVPSRTSAVASHLHSLRETARNMLVPLEESATAMIFLRNLMVSLAMSALVKH